MTIPSDSIRPLRAAGRSQVGAAQVTWGREAALDHRQPLAVGHLENAGAVPHSSNDDDNSAENDQAENNRHRGFLLHSPSGFLVLPPLDRDR